MDPELTALAGSAATALVAAWTTDTWTGVKHRLARLFGRRSAEQTTAAAAELDAGRADVAVAEATGDVVRRAEIECAWRERLRLLLSEEPTAAAELLHIVDELQQSGTNGAHYGGDHIEVHGNTFHGPVQVKGVQNSRG
ncbi:hypothetical protein [Streptomyces sp. NPDC021622]|uniref:hypothetical protein n=1 Tax=Streptomyces sp. NPDC021622 TaxID=3155013 RepID=UPI0033E22317